MIPFQILTFPLGPFATNTYIFICTKTREAVVIDPSFGAYEVVSKEKQKLKTILLTHSHFDHIADAERISKEFTIPVAVHVLDASNLRSPGSDGLKLPFPISSIEPHLFLTEGMIFQVGDLTLKILHTPGHSRGSVCFYCPEEKILFSGDTLFQGTWGNTSFPTSQPDLMIPSLHRLVNELPPETKVYPGHGESTTLEKESAWIKTQNSGY